MFKIEKKEPDFFTKAIKKAKTKQFVILQLRNNGMDFDEISVYLTEYKSFVKYIYNNY